VGSGAIGALRFIRGSFTFTLTRPSDIRLTPAMGGGSLWDVGCYPVSFMRTIVGAEPLEVFGWQVTGPTGIDDTYVGGLRFDGEVYGQFDCSFVIPFHAHMEIVGSEATLVIPTPFKPGLNERMFLVREDKTETLKSRGQELYLGEVEDITDAILQGKPLRLSLEDSRANVAALVALLESARTNKSVKM
jgi:predicted dehydrogenase